MSTALAEVELTKIADDGYVHVGDLVQLVHLETGSTVAGDVSDQDPRPGEEACAATAAGDVRSPCARNTFVITKYKPSKAAALEPYYDDDILRYGQKIRLALNPQAMGLPLDATGGQRPMCLFSKPLSMTHYAKYSRKQLVGLTARDTFDTVWQVRGPAELACPCLRLLSNGRLGISFERAIRSTCCYGTGGGNKQAVDSARLAERHPCHTFATSDSHVIARC